MKCENCGTEHSGEYGSGRFCNMECAMSYSTKFDNKDATKSANCTKCGNKIEINKRASIKTCKCEECKNKESYKNVCKGCGQVKPCKRPDICKKYRLFPTLAKYFGFDTSKIGTIEIYEEFDRIKNMLIEDYWDCELSLFDMVEKYEHKNVGSFYKILKSIGIDVRNCKDSAIICGKNGKYKVRDNYNYKQGGHRTGNGKDVFYRSSYELEYAKQLDEQQIDYSMENLRILYGDSQLLKQRVAIPDFYLSESNTIVEIKSDYTYNKQNMNDKIKVYKEHGYNYKVILEKKEIKYKGI